MTKTWDKPSIQTLIHSNPKALHRAIIKIYERQTADEQDLDQTIEHNVILCKAVDDPRIPFTETDRHRSEKDAEILETDSSINQ
jgi:hypothetical protein